MNVQQIAACTGSTLALAEVYAGHLTLAMDAYGITTPLRQAMFLANVGHESGRLAVTIESLNYRVEALLSGFGRHRISEADARKYGRTPTQAANQEAIGNCLYGGPWGAKNLGNDKPGDGFKFRGRGLIQTTGKSNVCKVRDRLRAKFPLLGMPDFEANPDALREPIWAALSAADFAGMRKLNDVADACNFDMFCDLINLGKPTDKFGDTAGWGDRLDLYRGAKVALGVL